MDEIALLPQTPEELYQVNLDLLARMKDPAFATQVNQIPLINLQLGPSASGALAGASFDTISQQWVPLCNMQDPVAEAITDADRFYEPKAKIFILFGMGLGYFAREMAVRLQPYQRMAIFETSPILYRAAMHAIDIGPLIDGHSRMDTFIGDGLSPHLEQWFLTFESHEKLHIAEPMRAGFTNIYNKAEYDTLGMKCQDMLRYHAVGLATWQQFGAHIGDNDVANLPEYFALPGITALKDVWKGKPAICIAAGPSLVKNLYLVQEIQQRFPDVTILSVATVYALLQGLGIVPDLVTTIDFQRLNYTDQIANVPVDPRSALLYLHSAYPDTGRRWPGPKFVARNASDMTQWMLRYAEDKGSAAQVQTVAHLNVVAALEMGCDPIILLGQDLSQPKGMHHAPGAGAQDTNVEDSPDSHIAADDVYGQPCWTRHSYLSMRTVFAKMFQDHPEAHFVNCTEGGLNIDGAVNRTLSEMMSEWQPADPFQREGGKARLGTILKDAYDRYVPEARWQDLLTDLGKLRDGVKQIGSSGETNLDRKRLYEASETPESKQLLADAILASEGEFTADGSVFSMIAVRRFDLIQLMSDVPLDGTLPPEDLARVRMERILAVSQAMADEWRKVTRNLDGAIARLIDLMPETRSHPMTWQEWIRLLARKSYLAAARRLPETWWDEKTAAHWLVVSGCLAMHRHEYAKAVALLDAASQDPGFARFARVRDRCQRLLDESRRRPLPFMAPYLMRLNGKDPTTVQAVETVQIDKTQPAAMPLRGKIEMLVDKLIAAMGDS